MVNSSPGGELADDPGMVVCGEGAHAVVTSRSLSAV
jgi:hypothetical protein